MANRFPLIFNSGAGQIQELAASDNLDLTSSNLVNAGILSTSSGSVTAPSLQIGSGTTYNPGLYSPDTDQLAVATNGTGRLSIDASGNVAVDTNTLYVDAVNNRVAIGTTSPIAGYLLDVRGSMYMAGTNSRIYVDNGGVGGSSVQIGVSGTSHGYIGTDGNFPLVFQPNNTERARIRADGTFEIKGAGTAGTSPGFSVNPSTPANSFVIDSSGRLGIGNSSPGAFDPSANQLVVGSGTGDQGVTLYAGTASSSTINFADGTASTAPYVGRILYQHASNAMTFHTNGGTEAVRIDSSQRLLVGTFTSRSVQDFAGNGPESLIQIEAANSTAIMSIISAGTADASRGGTLSLGRHRNATVGATPTVVQSGDLLGAICFAGGDGTDMLTKGASIACQVDGTPGADKMPGRLIFSTATDASPSVVTERMRIISSGQVLIGGIVTNPHTTADGIAISKAAGVLVGVTDIHAAIFARHNTDGECVRFQRNNSDVGSIDVTTTATSYNTSSDYRLKENIVDLDGAIDRLKQLPVHRFNFILDADHTVDGFIAHEAQAVVPECVTGTKDEVNAKGNPIYQGIDQSKLVPLLTAALQEAIAKIESLGARLTAAGIE